MVEPVTSIIGKAVTDKDLAAKLQHEVEVALIKQGSAELEAAQKVIVAEAQSDSWLTRNWRPVVMLALTACVVAHWLGFTPPNLTETSVAGLLDIVQVGLGGYVVSRGAEKVMQAYKS